MPPGRRPRSKPCAALAEKGRKSAEPAAISIYTAPPRVPSNGECDFRMTVQRVYSTVIIISTRSSTKRMGPGWRITGQVPIMVAIKMRTAKCGAGLIPPNFRIVPSQDSQLAWAWAGPAAGVCRFRPKESVTGHGQFKKAHLRARPAPPRYLSLLIIYRGPAQIFGAEQFFCSILDQFRADCRNAPASFTATKGPARRTPTSGHCNDARIWARFPHCRPTVGVP